MPLNKDEIENGMTSEDVVYECSDENKPGSVCKKTCAHGFIPSGPKQTKVRNVLKLEGSNADYRETR